MQLVSGDASAVEVVCPWSNTEETLIETMDEDTTTSFEAQDGHAVVSSGSQVSDPQCLAAMCTAAVGESYRWMRFAGSCRAQHVTHNPVMFSQH